jgi:acyl-CoA synthetase (AMP-forming)/AMP-acid ligase II/acyl carrier protein
MTAIPRDSGGSPFASLPAILARRACAADDRWRLTFLEGEGEERQTALDRFAPAVFALARHLAAITGAGEPVLLLYPPGIDFLIGFMACLAANRPAVPINPPRRNRLIERVDGILADTGARVALTTSAMLRDQAWWRQDDVPLARLTWQETDRLASNAADGEWIAPVAPDDIAFIQYTSGSTSAPKGVMVSHGNLVTDMQRMAAAWEIAPSSVMVTWLPAFHDLGLIFGLLQPLFSGCATVAMAPARFLQTPVRWLEAITRHRGTHTAAPSFAYDACVRRVSAEQRAALDLSSLRMAMNAAEPIDPTVMAAFEAAFGPCGYGPTVSCPAYGLAESTLAITGNPVGERPVLLHVDANALEAEGRAVPVAADAPHARTLVGCGRPLPDVGIRIVDPRSGQPLDDGTVGEVWASGPTIAAAYWNNPRASAETFEARVAGEDDTRHLRTGDLGFMHEGELVITGRLKDVIIIRGVNCYPQDFERAAFRSHPALRAECSAAFSLPATSGGTGGGTERLVIVQEVERVHRKAPTKPMFDAIRDAVWHGFDVAPHMIVLIEPGSVPRTSSGKIRRSATRTALLDGSLPVIAAWEQPSAASIAPIATESRPGPDLVSLRTWLLGWLAERLELPVDRIDADESFASYGLDSLSAEELAAELGRRLGMRLPQSLAWDHPTPNRLLGHLAALANPAPARTALQPSPSAGSRPSGKDLDELLGMIEGGTEVGR